MTDRPLRADARRNRERVLAAAQEAFAAEGISVPLDEIARRAGVGAGTVYRHFPTKEALFEAAILDQVEKITTHARGLTEAEDPGTVFFEFLELLVLQGTVKRDLADALRTQGGEYPRTISHDLKQALATLLSRAQEAGAVRPDIGVDDLLTIVKGVFLAVHEAGADPGLRERTFAVIADGLRTR
ncbi:TetR/AcrR family transcriptional regulator [Nocardia sp. CDC160]|uniref:TetR/AcrR family transcriptional regulator n=1 Tax=Nocardia sp. CDC160 TaxID=3112166 RepID=UPI002DB8A9E6|nr:TetR/AcrR family transcriptional regulator [Nocardia sp. CDC160]MEC3915367.1 TetR/AcrR family transcriptional regulator [Nocardia sp. CDC160]